MNLLLRVSMVTIAMSGAAMAAGCLGGQSGATQQRSDALGDRSGGVPPSTLCERDWAAAAKGTGAAGNIPAAELARLEKRSAPGGNLDVDAGAEEAGTAR